MIRQKEDYLFKIVDAVTDYLGIEMTLEEKADLVMLTLLNIKE